MSALQKLGESLEASEQSFLDVNASSLMKNFDQVTDEMGKYMIGFGLRISFSLSNPL